MELDLSSEQELLRETTARFIESTCPLPTVRQLIESDTGLPEGYFRAAGELGWFALLVPEEHEGGSVSGQGLCDLAIISEERGRALQPGPFVTMNVFLAALAGGGSAEQQAATLPSVRDGASIATWVIGAAGAAGSGSSITATAQGEGFVLSGHAGPVVSGAAADWFLVTAGGPEGVTQVIVSARTPGIAVTPLQGLDITQRFAAVDFDHVIAPPTSVVGEPGDGDEAVERQLRLACVLSTTETLGATDALFETDAPLRHRSHRIRPTDRFLPGGQAPVGRHQSVLGSGQSRHRGRSPGGAGGP